jgi:hypothetical protein
VFPVLLVWAARGTGERVPATVIRVLGAKVTVASVVVVFLAAVLLHGLVIWQDPLTQVAALAVFAGMVLLILMLVRSDVFRPRTVIELLRSSQRHASGSLMVVAAGVKSPAVVTGEPTRSPVSVEVPASAPRDAVVWAHTVTADGHSAGLTGTVTSDGSPPEPLTNGRARISLPPGDVTLQLQTALPDGLD